MVFRADAGDGAAGGRQRAADHVQLLQHDEADVRVVLLELIGRHQAGDARAHDDDVGFHRFALRKLGGFLLLLEGRHVHAAGRESGFHRRQDGFAGDGGAGHGVHRQALLLHDAGGNGLHRLVADAGGFIVLAHGDGRDAAVLIADGHRYVAAHAGRRGGIILRKRADAGRQQHTSAQDAKGFLP